MSFIANVFADIRTARLTRRGATARPGDVPRGLSKRYPRMPRITLPDPQPLGISLDTALASRRSNNSLSTAALSTQTVGTLFGHALRARKGGISRQYPSGGALFPIETYLVGNVIEGYSPAVFHYQPEDHALEHLWNTPADFEMGKLFSSPEIAISPMTLIFTSMWEKSSPKYGDFSYYLALLEAGHMAENILLVSAALGIGARPIGGFVDAVATDLLDLDGEKEQAVYAVALYPGTKPAAEESDPPKQYD